VIKCAFLMEPLIHLPRLCYSPKKPQYFKAMKIILMIHLIFIVGKVFIMTVA
jgi:hypothetical protein